MFNLTERQLSSEYSELYSTYNEGDTTESELETFLKLNPKSTGIYLNFGGGKWSKTSQTAKELDFKLIKFEPYADINENDNEYLITDFEKLKNYKFDGIMSHNVLEHLKDPIHTLIFLKSLLKNDECFMVHTTPCYNYCYEFTRFHFYFFTGNSLSVLCKKAGLNFFKTQNENTKLFKIK